MEELRSPGGKPRKKWRDSKVEDLHILGMKEDPYHRTETYTRNKALDRAAIAQNGAPRTTKIKNFTLEEHLAHYGLEKRWLHILKRQAIESVEDLYEKLRYKGVVTSLQRRVENYLEGEALSRLIQDLPYPVEDMPDPSFQAELQRLNLAGVNQEDKYLLPENHCLRLYIHNAGLDSVKYCEIFAAKGISTLSEMHHLFNDKDKFKKAFSDISETDKVNLQEVLEKSLNNAIHQEEILNKLGLVQYFPEKITLHIVMKRSVGKVRELHDVPWYVLSKILMLDHRGRDDLLPRNLRNDAETVNNENQKTKKSEDVLEDMFAELAEDSSYSSHSSVIHPTDVLVTVFQCSSNLLRQSICEKLFMCKLSIPLIWRQFFSSRSMFLLWSLRNIILGYKIPSGEFCESSLAGCHTSVVTCMKIGNIARSKSKFLNEVLNGQNHDTFFHRDCKNGMIDRKLSKGVIEIALYLPSAKESTVDQFSEVVTFANIRGDGSVFSENATFLQKFTNVFLVMVDVSEIANPDVITSLKMLTSSGAELVLMLSKASGVKFDEKIKLAIKNSVKELESQKFKGENIILDFTLVGDKNIKLLKDEVVAKINRLLEKKPQRYTLEKFKTLAESLRMTVDENSPECIKSYNMALEIIKDIKNNNIQHTKSQKLPLQSKPWQEWAKLSKEEKRLYKKDSSKSVDEYIANLHSKKMAERKEQLKYLENPHKFLVLFIESLAKLKDHERIYFMKWLKLHLDELSRKTLPGLQKKYNLKMDKISQHDNLETPRELQEELCTLIKDIAEASFGVEHLMREIGQAYEAVVDMSDKVKHFTNLNIEWLPKIMAEFMLFGYPLELMDGDASYVPLLWVKAVLKELKIITGDANIFVLSVLGIQSSGKSTLLNTMFGLQFPVAAGRCTRGVYAQLVPTNKGRDKTYDYILVVDTEGLRAPELGHGNLQHDNEIATLVVGLGDVTLVNIKGENVAELEEVLQIVVHAVLKMRLVNESLKLQPSCIFIHQNVGAADAAQKMKLGQQKFVDTLDKVTQAAGEQEDAPEFFRFHQVIDFDIRKHIRFISDLWKGDPPMASVNPGYSEKVHSVKEMLLNDTMKQRGAHLTVSKLQRRIEDLWKGILGQNFVFSFKNSIAMRIYTSLEKKLSDLSWSLGDNALKWLNKESNVILKHEMEFDVLETEMVKQLDTHLREVYDHTKAELERFFEEHEDRELLEQWRVNSLLKLNEVYEETLRKTRERLRDAVKTRRSQTDPLRDTKKYKEKIIYNSRKLADDLRLEEDFSEEILASIFTKHWNEWMTHLPEETAIVKVDIYNSVMNSLLTKFHPDQALLFKILEKEHAKRIQQNFSDGLKNHLRIQVHQQPTSKKNKRVSKVSMGRVFRNQTSNAKNQLPQEVSKTTENNRKEAQKCLEKLQEKVKSEINKQKVLESKHADSMINLVLDTVNQMSASGVDFISKAKFKVDMAVYVCQLASFEKSKSLKTKKQMSKDVSDETCVIKEIEVSPIFKDPLYRTFAENQALVNESLMKCCTALHRNIGDFDVDVDRHVTRDRDFLRRKKISIENCRNAVVKHVENMTEVFKSFFDDTEIQTFRDEHVSDIIRKVNSKIESAGMAKEKFKFTKTFRMEMTVHVCMFAIPVFYQKQKRYMESLDPRTLFEKNNKETCLTMFKNHYYKRRNEKALAISLSEKLCKAIQSMVEKDMPRKLSDEVRRNVVEVRRKSTLLPAVLNELLNEDSFEDYLLYLKNIDGCFDKWIRVFVNNYLFQEEEETGHTQYMMIASSDINAPIEQVCKDLEKTTEVTLEKGHTDDAILYWIRELQKGVTAELPITENELLSLVNNYNNIDLSSLNASLKIELEAAHENLYETFSKHDEIHLSNAHDESVYALIAKGCKGCTAKCPFCNAPCSLSSEDHVNRNIKHRALEHYPLACGGMRWDDTKKLLTENCSVLVAGDLDFRNEDTDYEAHPYKEYKALYKDWEIDGDATVEASPYWKWFLLQHAQQLTEKFEAELPDIPDAWKNITIDMARNSLYK